METVQTKSVWGFHFPLQMSIEMYIGISKHSKGGNYPAALFSVFSWFKSLLACFFPVDDEAAYEFFSSRVISCKRFPFLQ